ncbi:MAG: glycosyltransferase family A protein [Mycobacteriales bacterium]
MSADGPLRPALSVVVPSRDRPEMLARCLKSVRQALGAADDLVVVDSASLDADAVARVVAEHGGRLVRCDVPGVDLARNAGWRATTHELVLFTDDDVVVDEGWADAFARCAAEHPEADFLTGWIGVPDGQERGYEVAVKDDTEPAVLDRTTRGVLGHGASLAVRREALRAVGGWDEALGSGGRFQSAPEVDLFDRLLSTGGTGRFCPEARAWHDQWRSGTQIVRLHLRYGTGIGARLAKLLRTDRRRFLLVAQECLWEWGLLALVQHVRDNDRRRSAVAVVRMAGYLLGFARAVVVPLEAGHFRPRRRA